MRVSCSGASDWLELCRPCSSGSAAKERRMFCNNCGSPITAEQSVCPHCDRSTTGARVASAARTRVAEHIHLLAILWFVVGAFWLIPAFIMAVLAAVITVPMAQHGANKIAFVFAPGLFVILCIVFLVSAALRFATG